MDLRDKIRSIPDFPQKGILFRDITPVLQDAAYFRLAVDQICACLSGTDFDVILGPDARGFIFGAAAAYAMNKGFIPVRKAGKLPHDTIQKSYALEYGAASVEIHRDALAPGQNVVIVDDLLATGGTAEAICGLVAEAGANVTALAFLIELSDLSGREKLAGYDVRSVLKY